MKESVQALVALGSNLGERDRYLDAAVEALGRTPGVQVVRTSRWVETEPEDPRDPEAATRQAPFLNGVAELECTLPARSLLERLLDIEAAAGRVREKPNGARTLDLDLLFYGDERIEEPDLVVPHPRLELRTFVLEPLSQLDPHRHLPGCRRSVTERLAELNVRTGLRRHPLSWMPSR